MSVISTSFYLFIYLFIYLLCIVGEVFSKPPPLPKSPIIVFFNTEKKLVSNQ